MLFLSTFTVFEKPDSQQKKTLQGQIKNDGILLKDQSSYPLLITSSPLGILLEALLLNTTEHLFTSCSDILFSQLPSHQQLNNLEQGRGIGNVDGVICQCKLCYRIRALEVKESQ
ncbi:hypothetical protein L204_104625 [Cryptococcus depauperatus]